MLRVKRNKKKSKRDIARDFQRRKAWIEMREARRRKNIENPSVAEAVSTSAPPEPTPFFVKTCPLPTVATLRPELYRPRALFLGDTVDCEIEELPKDLNTTQYEVQSSSLVPTPVPSGLEPSLPLIPKVEVPRSPLKPQNNPITNVICSAPAVRDISEEVAFYTRTLTFSNVNPMGARAFAPIG